MFETGADVDMSAPILVVDPGAVGERGCNAHVQEVLGQIGDVCWLLRASVQEIGSLK